MPVILIALVLLLLTPPAHALTVLGVIAADSGGVALLRVQAKAPAVVARPGDEVEREVVLQRITREYVYVLVRGKLERIRVGEELDAAAIAAERSAAGAYIGMERSGNRVRVTAALRDHIVRNELSKVLMQAAAVPYYVNGQLHGFRLWDIDPGSVYELAGLRDRDIVTAINGNDIVDVGGTIRMLQQLKAESEVTITLLRDDVEQTITISVEP